MEPGMFMMFNLLTSIQCISYGLLPSDNVPVGHLVPLGEYLEVVELLGPGRGAPHVARVVVALRVGEVDHCVEVGAPLEELPHRPHLRVALVAIPGRRRSVGLVLPIERLEMQLIRYLRNGRVRKFQNMNPKHWKIS